MWISFVSAKDDYRIKVDVLQKEISDLQDRVCKSLVIRVIECSCYNLISKQILHSSSLQSSNTI